MMRVSCIVPAYNEAQRIGNVLAVATSHPLISDVIAVNDGSTDHTAQIVARFKAVRLPPRAHGARGRRSRLRRIRQALVRNAGRDH